MPTISPFRGYYPSPKLLGEMCSGRRFNRHGEINRDFNSLLAHNLILETKKPAYYILQVRTNSKTFTGLWTCTQVNDIAAGIIRGHEKINQNRVDEIVQNLSNGALDVNPVVINYDQPIEFTQLFEAICKSEPLLFSGDHENGYSLWNIDNEETLEGITIAFSRMGYVYLADGHHRSAALLELSASKLKQNSDTATEECCFSSFYLDSAELEIHPFHRIIENFGALKFADFIESLKPWFEITLIKSDFTQSTNKGVFVLLTSESGNYTLRRLDELLTPDLSYLEMVMYQLYPSIKMRFEGGPGKNILIEKEIGILKNAAAFLLFPPDMSEIRALADRKLSMPAKSSWFEPKIPSGLLIRKF